MKITRIVILGASLMVGVVLVIQLLDDWSALRIYISKKRAYTLIDHLNRYKESHGEYPVDLNTLMADTNEKIYQPLAGSKIWRYDASISHTYFTLSFGRTEYFYPCYSFNSCDQNWYLDD